MRYSAKENIGDGKLPNKYWVSESDGYYIRTREEDGSIYLKPCEEDNPKMKVEGKTYPKAFSTYAEALAFTDTLCNNQITIEDRLTGQVFESIKIVCPCCGKEEWETFQDIKYTKKRMEELGAEFK